VPVQLVSKIWRDVGGSGPHKLEILETNCTDNQPNNFALRSPKATHLLLGKHGEILGRIEVWWEKVACWSTKAAISLKSVKIDEKLLWRAYIELTNALSNGTIRYHPRPSMASPSPRLGFANPTQTAIAIISGTGKATNFKFGGYIRSVHPNRSPLNIWEKRDRAWAYPGTAQIFWVPRIISGTGYVTNFKFGSYIHRVHPNKSLWKIWEKKECGVSRNSA